MNHARALMIRLDRRPSMSAADRPRVWAAPVLSSVSVGLIVIGLVQRSLVAA